MGCGVVASGHVARLGQRRVKIEAGLEILFDQPSLEDRGEFLDHVVQGAGRGLAEAAMARRAQDLVEAHEVVELVARAVAGGDFIDDARHQRRADAARRAEAAALVLEEMGEVLRRVEQVASPPENHEGAGGGHVLEGDAAAEFIGRQAGSRGAADLHGGDVARAAIGQYLGDADAERIFVEARLVAIA